MKIAVIGVGKIGTTLAHRCAIAGHEVFVANSRGPDSLRKAAEELGVTPRNVAEVAVGVDAVITSVPLAAVPSLTEAVAAAPSRATVIDTGNFFPGRDGMDEQVFAGATETEWVQRVWGRPVTKAWNSIMEGSLAAGGLPAGAPNRIALPVAADSRSDRFLAMHLVELTGFDAVDAGTLAESWRQQPGSPAYTTDLTQGVLSVALESAERGDLAQRRRLLWDSIAALPGYGTHAERLALARQILGPKQR